MKVNFKFLLFTNLVGLLLLLGCASNKEVGQKAEFEGELYLDIKYVAHSDLGEKLIANLPKKGTYTYKSGKYLMTYNYSIPTDKKPFLDFSLYNGGEYSFTKFTQLDTLYTNNVRTTADYEKNMELINLPDTILQNATECKQFRLKNQVVSKTFIYSKNIYINPKHFSEYKSDNRDIFASNTSSIPLIYILETEYYTMISSVAEIVEKPVSDSLFAVPKLPISKKTK